MSVVFCTVTFLHTLNHCPWVEFLLENVLIFLQLNFPFNFIVIMNFNFGSCAFIVQEFEWVILL